MLFIEEHVQNFTREGVQYAVEKMPAKVKQTLLRLHREQVPKSKRAKLRDEDVKV